MKLKQIVHAAFLGIGVIWTGISHAAPAQSVGVKILSFGQYGAGGEIRLHAPGVGGARENETRHLIQQTSCITPEQKSLFGMVVRHTASDVSLRVPVQIVIKHPPFTTPDGTVLTSDSYGKILLSEGLFTGWSFDAPYEMVPGTWTIQVHHNGRVAAEKKFKIVAEGKACR